MSDLDPVELYELATNAGPTARAIAARREDAIAAFRERSGFDGKTQGLGSAFCAEQARERVVIGKPGESSFIASSFDDRPVLELPREIDYLSVLRAARADGFEHPSLASLEACAASAGRS